MSRTLGMLGLAVLIAACSTEQASELCRSDSDCDPGFVCQTETGACRCNTDDACGPGNYCNSFGVCQTRPPCLGNQDCAAGEICNSVDPSGGRCIPATECGSSVHCELNHYCAKVSGSDPVRYECRPGCRSHGDCELGKVCVGGQCTDAGDATDCSACPATPDPDPAYCDYGEVCTNEGACVPHPQASALCQSCGDFSECPDGLMCLVDDEVAGGNYCAPSCKIDSDCPSGFDGCGGVSIVFKQCSSDAGCGAAKCLGSAESANAYCGCASQSDCDIYANSAAVFGFDLCDVPLFGSQKECLTDGSPCTTNFDCACWDGRCVGTDLPCTSKNDCTLTCVQYQAGDTTVGTCETTAKVCGKASGLSCNEMQNGEAVCRSIF